MKSSVTPGRVKLILYGVSIITGSLIECLIAKCNRRAKDCSILRFSKALLGSYRKSTEFEIVPVYGLPLKSNLHIVTWD